MKTPLEFKKIFDLLWNQWLNNPEALVVDVRIRVVYPDGQKSNDRVTWCSKSIDEKKYPDATRIATDYMLSELEKVMSGIKDNEQREGDTQCHD